MHIGRIAELLRFHRNGQARLARQREACLEAFDAAYHRPPAQRWRAAERGRA